MSDINDIRIIHFKGYKENFLCLAQPNYLTSCQYQILTNSGSSAAVKNTDYTVDDYGIKFLDEGKSYIYITKLDNYINTDENFTIYFRAKMNNNRNLSDNKGVYLLSYRHYTSDTPSSSDDFYIFLKKGILYVHFKDHDMQQDISAYISDSEQHHFAFSRDNKIFRAYVDGIKIYDSQEPEDKTIDQALFNTNTIYAIQSLDKDVSIDDLVVRKGIALYRYFDFIVPVDLINPKDTKLYVAKSYDKDSIIDDFYAFRFDAQRIFDIIINPNDYPLDTKRQVIREYNSDTKINGHYPFKFDTERDFLNIINPEDSPLDTKRQVIREYNSDTKINGHYPFRFDTMRMFSMDIDPMDYPLDTKRQVIREYNSDTKINGHYPFRFDTTRIFKSEIDPMDYPLDTKRQVIRDSDDIPPFDTKRQVIRDFNENTKIDDHYPFRFDTKRMFRMDIDPMDYPLDTKRNVVKDFNKNTKIDDHYPFRFDTKRIVYFDVGPYSTFLYPNRKYYPYKFDTKRNPIATRLFYYDTCRRTLVEIRKREYVYPYNPNKKYYPAYFDTYRNVQKDVSKYAQNTIRNVHKDNTGYFDTYRYIMATRTGLYDTKRSVLKDTDFTNYTRRDVQKDIKSYFDTSRRVTTNRANVAAVVTKPTITLYDMKQEFYNMWKRV